MTVNSEDQNDKNECSSSSNNLVHQKFKVKDENLHEDLQCRMNVDFLQERFQELSDRLNDLRYNLVEQTEATKLEKTPKKDFLDSDKCCDRRRRKSSKDGILSDKEFLPRNSLLTDLFEIQHIKTIYNIFIVILIILFMSTAIHDIMETGTVHLGIQTIIKAFSKMPIVIHIWIGMTLSTFFLYSTFAFWAHKRLDLQPKSLLLKVLDYGSLTSFILYQIAFIIFPTKSVIEENLQPASSLIVLMEQVRMIMKTHAFVRSNTPRVLSFKPPTERNCVLCPGFSNFLYFMFAPTLVYRDNYPRTNEVRWKIVVWHYTEVILVIFYVAFLFERFLIPTFNEFGVHPANSGMLVLNIFNNMMPGILVLLCVFYCILHSWMNGSAELLQFADRMFYKGRIKNYFLYIIQALDWWNSTSFSDYYRTWNIVVHDWLHTYIYKDMYEIVTCKSKIHSRIVVFLVSAIFHEYILAIAFRFFYPVTLVMFGGLGTSFAFIPKEKIMLNGNIFFWLCLCTGFGIMLSLYAMEFYARINCAPYDNKLLDLFLPRSWFCRKAITSI